MASLLGSAAATPQSEAIHAKPCVTSYSSTTRVMGVMRRLLIYSHFGFVGPRSPPPTSFLRLCLFPGHGNASLLSWRLARAASAKYGSAWLGLPLRFATLSITRSLPSSTVKVPDPGNALGCRVMFLPGEILLGLRTPKVLTTATTILLRQEVGTLSKFHLKTAS